MYRINIDAPCIAVLVWQDICRGYHAILVQNSVCEDSEVSRSRLPIRCFACDSREPSSCMIVGSSISYHSMKQCRILRENLNKFPAKAIHVYVISVVDVYRGEVLLSVWKRKEFFLYFPRKYPINPWCTCPIIGPILYMSNQNNLQ